MRKFVFALMALTGCASAPQPGTLSGRFAWSFDHGSFGGFSGLEVLDNGDQFITITDSGVVYEGHFERAGGAITGMTVDRRSRLKMPDGQPVSRDTSDSEGLAIAADGTAYISFEGQNRIAAYADLRQPPVRTLTSGMFDDLALNAGLEAVAIDADNQLFAIPERSGRAGWPFPVYRFDGAVWVMAFELPRRGSFLAVGADFGPDGLLYVLERDFTGIGFRSRVRRFDAEGRQEEVIFTSGNGTYDNLEGISVWRDSSGDTVITMISDDNFNFFQRTEVVEYRIDGPDTDS